MVSYDLPVFFF